MACSHETWTKPRKIDSLISKNLQWLKLKLQNENFDISLVIIAQPFPHEKSTYIQEFPLFSINLINVYWAVSYVVWRLCLDFVGTGHMYI